MIELMRRFADRKYLRKKHTVELDVWSKTNRYHLFIEDPRIVARFIAEVKNKAQKGHKTVAYLRGQVDDHPGMIPRWFRGSTDTPTIHKLLRAYRKLLAKIRKERTEKRFKRPKLGALLQHYGLCTPWLDVVDNLYVAVWFALHRQQNDGTGRLRWIPSDSRFGWIHVLGARQDGTDSLEVCDLRTEHHSLSVRPQVQHAIAVRKRDEAISTLQDCDLNHSVLASVRIPNTPSWFLCGSIASAEFMFPGPNYDDTYKKLRKRKTTVQIVETEIGIGGGGLTPPLPCHTTGRTGPYPAVRKVEV